MAFLQSEPPREPFLHAPASVLWLIGVLVLAHVARMAVPAGLSDELLTQYAFIPARYSGGVDIGGIFGLAAPFVSHMFLHANFVHLGVNCVWLLAFGPIVARRYGTMLFLLFLPLVLNLLYRGRLFLMYSFQYPYHFCSNFLLYHL